MANFKVCVETSPRNGNFIVRYRDGTRNSDTGRLNQFTECTIEKTQRMVIDGEAKTGKWLANAIKDQVMTRYLLKKMGGFDLSKKISDLVEEYMAVCESNNLSPATIRHYDISLRRFMEEGKAPTLNDLTREKFTDWKIAMAAFENSTIRGRLGDVRTFCQWLVSEGKISESPFGKKMIPEKKVSEPRFYTRSEFLDLDRALADVHPMARLACNMAHDMGMRKIEFVGDGDERRGVLWEDILWHKDGKTDLVLRNEVVKGQGEGRVLRFTRGVLALLGSKSSGPIITITRAQLDHLFADARKAAKINPTLDIHGLRHTFAKNYLQHGGGNLASLKDILGHKDISTTQIYSKFEKSYLAEGVEQAYAKRIEDEALLKLAGQNLNITPEIIEPACTSLDQPGLDSQSNKVAK